jgi:hypothetical protein
MIIVLYTDDCLLYARDTKNIDSFVKHYVMIINSLSMIQIPLMIS